MSFYTINPTTEEIIREYQELSEIELDNKITSANKRFSEWKKTSFAHRSNLMLNAAKILRNKKNDYAGLMALEMGKPLAQGISEVEKCAWCCEFYAENAEKFLSDENVQTQMSRSFISYQPIGAVLAIMPWNFPFWQVFRFAAPALMAGNVGVLKHARNTMGCAEAIEEIFLSAGFPESVFTNLVIGSSMVDKVIENKFITAVTLTGSTPVGQQVAAKAGSLIKKSVLELGGNDAYVVLEDADLDATAETCVTARLINSGQSCIAAKRFIVSKKVLHEFENLFIEKIKTKKMGNPFDSSVYVGPQARKDLQLELHRQVEQSVSMGANLRIGGELPQGKGYFYPPTVLTDVQKGMLVYDEETFGPVAAIIPAESDEDAIEKANDSIFGLGAAVFTRDVEKGTEIAKNRINAGCCFVNDFVKSDPRLPFGGVKLSGYGRELSHFGIREFVNIKTICVV
jgi:succinate-semialdehyde dehydrogenase / glutarate-semialdehyde dehydrogenase